MNTSMSVDTAVNADARRWGCLVDGVCILAMNDEPVAGVNPNGHMDMLMEMDLVVGSLVSKIEEEGLGTSLLLGIKLLFTYSQ